MLAASFGVVERQGLPLKGLAATARYKQLFWCNRTLGLPLKGLAATARYKQLFWCNRTLGLPLKGLAATARSYKHLCLPDKHQTLNVILHVVVTDYRLVKL